MSLFEQLQTLHHTEPMLLINNGQAQLPKLDIGLQQRMGSDGDVRQAFSDKPFQLRLLALRIRSSEQNRYVAEFAKQSS